MPSDEGPEARMYREKREQQARDEDATDRLLASIKPEHANRVLIPWAMIVKWKLPHRFYPL